MKKIIVAFLFSSFVVAQEAELVLIDEDISPTDIGSEFKIHRPEKKKNFLPQIHLRDKFLMNIPESRDWDEYRKDSFYMDIKHKKVEEILLKYPNYNEIFIRSLKGKI